MIRAGRLLLITCCLSAGGLPAALLVASDDFPYSIYVAVEGAEVLSGPGHRYYATQHLTLGTEVEVYREEASGWLAIRPPEGSFSWLPAEAVERTSDQKVGRVLEATGAWIGTIAEQVDEHRQHVTLKSGELVQILGEKVVAHEDEEQVWLKIAPPAGEFRWIHLRDVSRQKPEPRAVEQSARNDAALAESQDGEEPGRTDRLASSLRALRDVLAESGASRDRLPTRRAEQDKPGEPRSFQPAEGAIALHDLEPAGSEHTERRSGAPWIGARLKNDRRYRGEIETVQFRNSIDDPARPSLSPDGFVPRKRKGGSQQLETVPLPSPHLTETPPSVPFSGTGRLSLRDTTLARAVPLAASRASSDGGSGLDAQAIGRELDQIEVDLSLMLAQDKSLWNLGALKARVNQLVESGPDPVARGRARLVLDKIEEFAAAFDVAEHTALTAMPAVQGAGEATASSPADPRYDGQGWLKPVISRKGDTPPAPFALVDAEGKPRCFVTPSPGLNINRYLNKQVGVYGRRGYIESLKTPHVVVERAIDLER